MPTLRARLNRLILARASIEPGRRDVFGRPDIGTAFPRSRSGRFRRRHGRCGGWRNGLQQENLRISYPHEAHDRMRVVVDGEVRFAYA